GVYLPGLRASDGFAVVVRVIHSDDRFNPLIPPHGFALQWQSGSKFDLWSAAVPITTDAATNFGSEGRYPYRYQLLLGAPGQTSKSVGSRIHLHVRPMWGSYRHSH